MLYTETVEPRTFSLLKELLNTPELRGFYLVGGTALSLIYGHRKSVDIDLFSAEIFETQQIAAALVKSFKGRIFIEQKPPQFGIFCYIDDIKVDLVRHPHSLIAPPIEIEEIRMFSLQDIVAMKAQAIFGRGNKKDFWDVAELLNYYSVDDFARFHKQKYNTQNLLISVPEALIYFHDAEESQDPISLKQQTWDSIKKVISAKVKQFFHQ